MNVKKGDLAIIIKSSAGNSGKIVEVLEFLGENPIYNDEYFCINRGPCWLVHSDRPLNSGEMLTTFPIPDAWLRPVSGLDVGDEDLASLSDPQKEKAL